jgi:hypothetical protein
LVLANANRVFRESACGIEVGTGHVVGAAVLLLVSPSQASSGSTSVSYR